MRYDLKLGMLLTRDVNFSCSTKHFAMFSINFTEILRVTATNVDVCIN